MDSERNPIINEVNWNILVTSGKEIKRDSMISVLKNIYILLYGSIRKYIKKLLWTPCYILKRVKIKFVFWEKN